MKKFVILLCLIGFSVILYGQGIDTVYSIRIEKGYDFFGGTCLKWSAKNDTCYHRIYIFGECENEVKLIDSIPNVFDVYRLPKEETEIYEKFFVGYYIGTTFFRSESIR